MKLTHEMIKAGCKAFLEAFGDPAARPMDYAREITAALTAALSAQPAPQVAVKPLEWRIFCSRSLNSEAKTPFGEYVTQSETDGWCLYLAGKQDAEAAYTTLEAAKAAAQADYERRILSALTTPPADQQENELLRRAARRAEFEKVGYSFSPDARAAMKGGEAND